jgi:hypothetical protein
VFWMNLSLLVLYFSELLSLNVFHMFDSKLAITTLDFVFAVPGNGSYIENWTQSVV